jgi:hypothetical protein
MREHGKNPYAQPAWMFLGYPTLDAFIDAAWPNYVDQTRAAIVATLNAWPNAKTLRDDGRRQTYIVPALILPLTQEARDE